MNGSKRYRLSILPLFEEDLNSIADYISVQLNNPSAALKLADDVESAIKKRLPFAESFEPHRSLRARELPYYRIDKRAVHTRDFSHELAAHS